MIFTLQSVTTLAFELAATPVLAASAYLTTLSLFSSRRATFHGGSAARFDVIVPAHDEERGIQATIISLLSMDYDIQSFRILVVADNCKDNTAALARSAGATVIERNDPTHRGKGYALAAGYKQSLADGFADAVLVVDADSVVSKNLLTAFASRMDSGTEAMQAEYGVRNANASWRTRLMVIAFALFHTLRSLGRERLGLSCGLRGNGMALSTDVLRGVPPEAFSLVEDVEYGILLGLAGTRVAYVHEAQVLGEIPASAADSRSQRERWESGRLALKKKYFPTLLRTSLYRRDPILLDLALDLAVPPLTVVFLLAIGGTAVATIAFIHAAITGAGLACWLAALAGLAIYIARGVAVSGMGPRAALDLLGAPFYIFWKLALLGRTKSPDSTEWVRTARTDAP